MGKVLIIKNNNRDERINNYARQSYEQSKKYYYNAVDGTLNEQALNKLKDNFEGNGIVLMITYENSELKKIKDVFIGDEVDINDRNSIEYIMRVHLTKSCHERVIASIIDKIDLDIDADFGYGQYVIMNDMESLYHELRERIIANKKDKAFVISEKEEQPEETYELSALAQKDEQSVRVYPSDSVGKGRTEFQRDRERVVNCKAFRRLVDKAQIFGSEKGDYYRTRMTHSLEVNQIAKAIAYALRLNLDLTEAIALGHDLGHTPFGHQGERTLDEILCGKKDVGINATDKMFEKRCFGGFKHNYQSAKILTEIEEKYKEFSGLNVSVQVVEGVLKHTKLKPDEIDLADFLPKGYTDKISISNEKVQVCSSLEGQAVAIADEIAQRGHDVDDALTSGVMTIEEFKDRLKIDKCKELFNRINKEINDIEISNRLIIDKKELIISRIVSVIINYFIQKTIEHSLKMVQDNEKLGEISLDNNKTMVCFSWEVERVNSYLEKVVQKKVICNNEVARADYNASMIVQKLFAKYYRNPRLLHSGTVHKIFIETLKHENREVSNSAVYLSDGSIELVNKEIEEITSKTLEETLILEYLENIDNSRTEKDIVIFEKRRILIRAITDYIAGMTDGYALEEYEKLK
ncbi:MAG: dNTP triphosphohydrolase [Lachnospiraceae bacterium]|nr:dNTP triphosphohydrolase [Lachnospiraceae bacterium]